eukprot:4226143-Pyramimonas_sp.AAC.3
MHVVVHIHYSPESTATATSTALSATVPAHPGPLGRGYIGYFDDEYDSALQEIMGAPPCIAPLLCG